MKTFTNTNKSMEKKNMELKMAQPLPGIILEKSISYYADGMANSVDPNQTRSALFCQTCQSHYLELLLHLTDLAELCGSVSLMFKHTCDSLPL